MLSRNIRSLTKREAVLGITLLVLLSLGIPLVMTDGTEDYTGIERVVAEEAISHAYGTDTYSPVAAFARSRITVEDVLPVSPDERRYCSQPFRYHDDPETTQHYVVVVSYRLLFGIPVKTDRLYGCRIFG